MGWIFRSRILMLAAFGVIWLASTLLLVQFFGLHNP